MRLQVYLQIVIGLLSVVPAIRSADAALPSVEQALKLTPIQSGVDFVKPTVAETAKCRIAARRTGSGVGWIVEDAEGLPLRRFIDTNGDNVVDQWCYYKNGLEVYRDIDADFDGKADQYRWFHMAGGRWGLDKDEDGQIDSWKVISAEEVTGEVIAALAQRDAERFARLVISPDELKTLGLGKKKAAAVAERIASLHTEFKTLLARQKAVSPGSKWLQFSGTQPGVVPAGTNGSTKDLQVYENVIAIVETGGQHGQVQIGTLVKVGDAWRVIGVPLAIADDQTDLDTSGLFFQASLVAHRRPTEVGPDDDTQKLLADLEKLDQAAEKASTAPRQAEFHVRRADLVEKIAESARASGDRAMWLRQLADMVGAAVLSGTYPEGAKRLSALYEKFKEDETDKNLAAYFRFRQLTAEYTLAMQAQEPDFTKIQEEWLKGLKSFVAGYPSSPDAAEAMLQLAIAEEFAGREDEAKEWYGRIVEAFPDSAAAKKAAGARRRLDSVGKRIRIVGKSPSGSPIDLATYRGRVVLIQYWATWCKPAVRDMALLKESMQKHAGKFSVIGVSLDSSREALNKFLAENRLPWPQIYEPGGLDSPGANQLGILTLPTMILVDRQGKVANRNVRTSELEAELQMLIR